MKRYEVVFVFDSEIENKWAALLEWYKKDNVLKDTEDFVVIEEKTESR